MDTERINHLEKVIYDAKTMDIIHADEDTIKVIIRNNDGASVLIECRKDYSYMYLHYTGNTNAICKKKYSKLSQKLEALRKETYADHESRFEKVANRLTEFIK